MKAFMMDSSSYGLLRDAISAGADAPTSAPIYCCQGIRTEGAYPVMQDWQRRL
jgi:hypothetical protein